MTFLRCAGVAVFVVYLLFSLYATVVVFRLRLDNAPDYHASPQRVFPAKNLTISIYSLTNSGLYLWLDILKGSSVRGKVEGGLPLETGRLTVGNHYYKFYHGKAVVPTMINYFSDVIIFALNGRSDSTVATATTWLNSISARNVRAKVILFLIGNENCINDWIRSYLDRKIIHKLFIVYDADVVDEIDVFQWPLGPALYRRFPAGSIGPSDARSERKYACNLMVTVYPNSSRERLVKIIEDHGLEKDCYVQTRDSWPSHEQPGVVDAYRAILLDSDLTLCPVGYNAESYRIYEAAASGSVPVIENRIGMAGGCRTSRQTASNSNGQRSIRVQSPPLRLLKYYEAPFIYVRDWNELVRIVAKERELSVERKAERRRRLLEWYARFGTRIREHFVRNVGRD